MTGVAVSCNIPMSQTANLQLTHMVFFLFLFSSLRGGFIVEALPRACSEPWSRSLHLSVVWEAVGLDARGPFSSLPIAFFTLVFIS